jgi:hypothetical protein
VASCHRLFLFLPSSYPASVCDHQTCDECRAGAAAIPIRSVEYHHPWTGRCEINFIGLRQLARVWRLEE